MDKISRLIGKTFTIGSVSLTLSVSGVLEILIFSIFIYYVIMWVKRTNAWNLLKGAATLIVVYVIAKITGMNNISYLFEKFVNSLVVAVIIILQPEIRAALERLGRKANFSDVLLNQKGGNVSGLSDESVEAIVTALTSLGRHRVGALIIIEKNILLSDFISTGIELKAVITAQLLEQIFEHNTPLHDGAVIIRGDKIEAATCYLPLSQNSEISKELGTRHRAGLGISEVSDCITLIASEETGLLSICQEGVLKRKVSPDTIRKVLTEKPVVSTAKRKLTWRSKNEN